MGTSEGGSLASELMKVDVPVVSDDACRDSYGQNDIADSMICAGLPQEERTPARETPAVPSCAATSSQASSAGDTAVPSPATLGSTPRPASSSTGSTATKYIFSTFK